MRQVLSDARHEPYNVEGARDERICPSLCGLAALFFRIQPGQHENGNIILCFDRTANVETIHHGHTNIQQDEIGLLLFDLLKGIKSMRRDHYLEDAVPLYA